MKFFFKKDNPPTLFHFRKQDYPYAPRPGQPLIHGTLANGDIDWNFWKQQEIWTLAQAIGLMQGYPGDEWHTLAYDIRNREYIEKLNVLLKSGAAYTVFHKITMMQGPSIKQKTEIAGKKVIGETLVRQEHIVETSEVYAKEFVRWAYENDFILPCEVIDMLPTVLRNKIKTPEHKNISLNLKPYIEAWQQKTEEKTWADRRAVTAHLLSQLGFTAKQIYMALSGKGEAEADPDRQVRNWKEKGKLLVGKNTDSA